jgi:hypothetical protein
MPLSRRPKALVTALDMVRRIRSISVRLPFILSTGQGAVQTPAYSADMSLLV